MLTCIGLPEPTSRVVSTTFVSSLPLINGSLMTSLLLLLFLQSAHCETNLSTGASGENYTMSTHTYKQVESLDIKADVFLPKQGARTKPAILWIHGGALVSGSRTGLPPEKQFEQYMKAGYVLVSIDYRLAPVAQLAEIILDVEDAYAWLREQGSVLFNIDPDRIAVMGMSAGGYLTLTAGFRLNPRPKALVSFYGYGDITGDWYAKPDSFYLETQPLISVESALKAKTGVVIANTDSLDANQRQQQSDFYLYCRQKGLWPNEVSGHDPAEEPEWFAQYEARKNVTPSYPPTLLLHGEKDTDVPFHQSLLMAKALAIQGVEHQLISQSHWEHVFDHQEDDPTVIKAHNRVLGFLDRHLK